MFYTCIPIISEAEAGGLPLVGSQLELRAKTYLKEKESEGKIKVKEESKVEELKHVSQNLNSIICKYTEKEAMCLILIKYCL